MALEGSLRDFDLFSLFNMVKTQGKSGTLVLSRGQEFVKIFFDQGEIIGCDSNQVRLEDRIGAMLVRLGRLSGEELLSMIQKQRQSVKRLGELLIEAGHISAQDLEDALFNQAMSILYRTFRWIEGDYRFDSMLPPDMDREHFPPIPVDTVLMEAARIMDEWPEVQRRLPDQNVPLQKTKRAQSLKLDMDKSLSGVLDGRGSQHTGSSGLTHEQEIVLTYFSEPQDLQSALQITRYDELETCKRIAELLEMGMLEISTANKAAKPIPSWRPDEAATVTIRKSEPATPSGLLWPLLCACIALPIVFYTKADQQGLNQGLASLTFLAKSPTLEAQTRQRMIYALALTHPADGGKALARDLGITEERYEALPNWLLEADPMAPPPPPPLETPKGKVRKGGKKS